MADFDAAAAVDGFLMPNPATAARAGMAEGVTATPDLEAKLKGLADVSGLPIDTVRQFPDRIGQQAKVQAIDFDALATQSPGTAKFLSDPQRAKLAHDDVENLTKTENVLKAWKGPEPSFGSVVSGLLQSPGQGFRAASQGISNQIGDLFDTLGILPRNEAQKADALRKAAQASEASAYTTPEFDSSTARAIYGGASSTLRIAPAVAMSIAARSAVPVLAAAGIQSQGEAYAKYRGRGGQPLESFAGASAEGAVEVATELLPMSFLTGQLGKAGVGHFVTGLLAREIPGEQIATLLQDAVDTAVANPNKTWKEYLEERPGAAYETLVSTLTQTAIMSGAHGAMERLGKREQAAKQAEPTAAGFEQLNELAKESKVKARDAETFEAFIAQAVENNPVSDVYISAQALAQSGVADQVMAASPSVQNQYEVALETGGDVRIPVEEYAGSIAGQDFAQSLVDHLKTEPEGFSRAEAKTFMEQQGEEASAEVGRVLDQQQGSEAIATSRAKVQENILAQLTAANRFTADVNRPYASLYSSYYATQGARLGLTPEEMFAQYPVLIATDRLVGDSLSQGQRGAYDPATSTIGLFKGADLTTLAHEGGHHFLDIHSQIAAATNAPAEVRADMDALLKWFDIKPEADADALTVWHQLTLDQQRESHEKFARGFEAFLFEGRAPSIELQGIFQRFRAWLLNVYRDIKKLNVTLTDEVRGVMGRMIATAEQIQNAEAAAAMNQTFSPEEAAKVGADFRDLHEKAMAATQDAITELEARSLRDMKWLTGAKGRALKKLQAEAADRRKGVRAEVTSEVMAQPVYQAWQYLTGRPPAPNEESQTQKDHRQRVADHKAERVTAEADAKKAVRDELIAANPEVKGLRRGQLLAKNKRQIGIDVAQRMLDWDQAHPVPVRPVEPAASVEADRYGKLDRKDLKDRYGAGEGSVASVLISRRMTVENGENPDITAELFGFDSGDAMLQALAEAMPPREVIEARTDSVMLERYGDINSPEALARAADEAVHNEARQRLVAAELAALDKAVRAEGTDLKGRVINILPAAARDFAERLIARKRVRDIRPEEFRVAEARAARESRKALGAGKLEEAALAKRNQLINGMAVKAAHQARAEVEKALSYFRRLDSKNSRNSIDQGYTEQIDALLEPYDLRKQSLKAIDRRTSLAEWVEQQRELGIEPNIAPEIIAGLGRKSYRDASLEELRGLVDAVKQIEHLGRLKNKLLTARDKREFDAIRKEMVESIVTNGPPLRPVELEGPNPIKDWFAGIAAQHRTLSHLFRRMDGESDTGPIYRILGRAMNERATDEDVRLEKATMALRAIYEPVLKLRGGVTGYRSKLFIPEINASLTRGGRLSVALNWGNADNRQRIMDGDGWTEAQVTAILKTLSPVELKFVNDVWEHIDTYWSDIEAKEKRVTGVAPPKVEAVPFDIGAADGTIVRMRGGYYPLKYDPTRSDRASQQDAAEVAKEMMRGATARATTKRGHTIERAKSVDQPVRKDLNVITQHISQVTHDLVWHEWLIDANKLLNDRGVVEAIRGHYGPQVLKTVRDGIQGIAAGDLASQTSIDKALLLLRSNVTRATMGGSLTTAFLQPFGLTQSMARIGSKHVLRGLARWGGDAARMESSVAWIQERSEFMRLRGKTFNRELREIRGAVGGKSETMRVVDGGLFWFMRKMQTVADVPTWLGQYEKSMAQGLSEEEAVAQADRAVGESQGGGHAKDMSELQRRHPMLTQFFSYFSVTLNLAVEKTAVTNFKNPRAVAGWMGDMALLMAIPAVIPPLILHLFKGGDDDEIGKKMAEWQLSYLLGSVVGLRELSSAVSGFDYAGPPVGRIVADIGKAGKQTAQGELDDAAIKAYIKLAGSAFGIPVTQALRSYEGWKAWDEGKAGAGPQSVLLGPPPKN